jgi:hypothetical protein
MMSSLQSPYAYQGVGVNVGGTGVACPLGHCGSGVLFTISHQ